MANYKIVFKRSVTKDLRPIPAEDVRRILAWIDQLTEDPRPPGAERLTGDDKYRIRQGRYRLLYTVADAIVTVTVVKVGHRHNRGLPVHQKSKSTEGELMINIAIDQERLVTFCQQWEIAELALFGSVLRDDFAADSDVDVLVRFKPNATHGLFDLVRMQEELKAILGREVDLVESSAVEKSRNYIRREAILNSTETIYETR